MAQEFAGKVIWVTGGFGGLGAAVVQSLAAGGATVIASGRTVPASTEGSHGLAVDVTDRASVDAAAAQIIARFGRIDGLVASTNLPAFGDFLDLGDEAWEAVFQTKLLGSVRPVRAVLPHLLAQGEGSIVLISGRGGIDPSPQHFPGSSINAALSLLANGLGRRYGEHGVRVNAVSPGPIKSPRLDAMLSAGAELIGTAHTGDITPVPGPGLPGDVADAVLFLLSQRARFVNGVDLLVDGGGRRFN